MNLLYSTYNEIVSAIIAGLIVFLISCLFWIGYLSLVRRIKARTLWKNSFLRKCLHFLGLGFHKNR